MFYDRKDCIRLSRHIDEYGTESGIFLFKNYVKPEHVQMVQDQLANADQKDFKYPDTLIDWYAEKVSPSVDGLIYIWEEISELIGPEWVMHPANNLLTIRPGDKGMFCHSDSPGKGQCHLLSQIDSWSTCCELDYGLVAYFGDYEGGELYYPNINPDGTVKDGSEVGDECFEYKPEKGDVVIHSAFHPYNHGVREVTSGIRYAYANFVLKAIDNPGTFYNYGTPEYKKQIGNKTYKEVIAWMEPLKENPQFSDEVLKKIRSSGLSGEELSETFFKNLKK